MNAQQKARIVELGAEAEKAMSVSRKHQYRGETCKPEEERAQAASAKAFRIAQEG